MSNVSQIGNHLESKNRKLACLSFYAFLGVMLGQLYFVSFPFSLIPFSANVIELVAIGALLCALQLPIPLYQLLSLNFSLRWLWLHEVSIVVLWFGGFFDVVELLLITFIVNIFVIEGYTDLYGMHKKELSLVPTKHKECLSSHRISQ